MIKPVIYNGDDPYIFISYAHADTELVWPILVQMQKDGYRFWYDDGIEPGSSWDDVIGEHVLGSGYFLAFLSEAYLASDNCQQELKFALTEKKTVLTVFLHPMSLPAGLRMRLSTSQCVSYDSDDELDFFEKLGEAEGLGAFRTAGEAEEIRPAFKELWERCAKAMKNACYCEALYLEREAMDVCLTSCLYHMGLLHKTSSPRLRACMRPLLLSPDENEAETERSSGLGVASLENRLELLRRMLRWARRQADAEQKPAEKSLQAVAAQLNPAALDRAIRLLRDADAWRVSARGVTGELSHNRISVAARAIPDLATEGHRCVHELSKLEKSLRKGNRVRKAMGLPVD